LTLEIEMGRIEVVYPCNISRIVRGCRQVATADIVVGYLTRTRDRWDEILLAGVVGDAGTVLRHVEEVAALMGVGGRHVGF